MIAFAVENILSADSNVTGQLATYEKTTGAAEVPAIFAYDSESGVIPEDAGLPAVIINEVGGVNFGTRDEKGAKTVARVRVYGNRDRKSILSLAWDIWKLLDRAVLTQTGWTIYGVFAEPPQSLSDPDGFPGYVVDVSAFVSE